MQGYFTNTAKHVEDRQDIFDTFTYYCLHELCGQHVKLTHPRNFFFFFKFSTLCVKLLKKKLTYFASFHHEVIRDTEIFLKAYKSSRTADI